MTLKRHKDLLAGRYRSVADELLDPIFDEAQPGGPFTEAEARKNNEAQHRSEEEAAEQEARQLERLRARPKAQA